MANPIFGKRSVDTIHRSVNLRIVTLVGDAIVTGTLERLEITARRLAACW